MFNNVNQAINGYHDEVLIACRSPENRTSLITDIFQRLDWSTNGFAAILIPIRTWVINRQIKLFILNQQAEKISVLVQKTNALSRIGASQNAIFADLRKEDDLEIFSDLDIYNFLQNPIHPEKRRELSNMELWQQIKSMRISSQEANKLSQLVKKPPQKISTKDKQRLLELHAFFAIFRNYDRPLPAHIESLLEACKSSPLRLFQFDRALFDSLKNQDYSNLMEDHKGIAEHEPALRFVGDYKSIYIFDKLVKENTDNRLFKFSENDSRHGFSDLGTWKNFSEFNEEDQNGPLNGEAAKYLAANLSKEPYQSYSRLIQQFMSQHPLTGVLSIFKRSKTTPKLSFGNGTIFTEVSHEGNDVFIKRTCRLPINESMSMEANQIGRIEIQVEFAIREGEPSVERVSINDISFDKTYDKLFEIV
ncbi:MAG: hypothetical protein COT84_00705 [Chlamydiae bacterium CG10_big_fil_rev_8_21_14_0_10_35_9]|nr:MAG: hypothetical protein COT84_00705 [Chlamydiae bacterium CG10_big_fil_rev_8_21_14_0_10_35_9]